MNSGMVLPQWPGIIERQHRGSSNLGEWCGERVRLVAYWDSIIVRSRRTAFGISSGVVLPNPKMSPWRRAFSR